MVLLGKRKKAFTIFNFHKKLNPHIGDDILMKLTKSLRRRSVLVGRIVKNNLVILLARGRGIEGHWYVVDGVCGVSQWACAGNFVLPYGCHWRVS